MKPSNIQGAQWLQGHEDCPLRVFLADTLILFQSGEGADYTTK